MSTASLTGSGGPCADGGALVDRLDRTVRQGEQHPVEPAAEPGARAARAGGHRRSGVAWDEDMAGTIFSVTVRRHQGNFERSSNDFVVRSDNLEHLVLRLREVLCTAQAQRGTGIWSTADPELWIGTSLVGKLVPDGDISQLVRRLLDLLR